MAIDNQRQDIQALRAIAVLAVFIFHIDNDILKSGFAGVDIFLVISGYLITKIILRDISCYSDYLLFLTKRINRILPSLFVVLIITTIAGFFILMPDEYSQFGKSLRYASAQISNILFQKNINYFDKSFENNALLHTWSLGLEMQFYFLFSLICFLIIKFFKRDKITYVVILLSIASVISSYIISDNKIIFYSIFSRFWQFGCGGIAAIILNNYKDKFKNIYIYYISFIITISALFIHPSLQLPSTASLIISLSVAFFILTGTYNYKYCALQKLLQNRILQIFGDLSYTIYLLHWPIISLYKYETQKSILTIKESLLIFFICISASLTISRFIENPLRKLQNKSTKYLYKTIIVYLAIAIIFVSIGKQIEKDGLHFRLNMPQEKSSVRNFDSFAEKCFFLEGDKKKMKLIIDEYENCIYNSKNRNKIDILLIGDSHALHYAPVIYDFAKKRNLTVLSISGGCPPLVNQDIERIINPDMCSKYSITIENIIKNNNIKYVFLAARWNTKINEMRFKNSDKASFEAFSYGVNKTLEFLQNKVEKIIIMGQVPILPKDMCSVYDDIAINLAGRKIENTICNISSQKINLTFYQQTNFLQKLVNNYKNVVYIDPTQIFCNTDYCIRFIDNKPLYYGDNHINVDGANFVIQKGLLDKLEF